MKFRRIINKLFEIVKSFGAFKYSIKKKKKLNIVKKKIIKDCSKKKNSKRIGSVGQHSGVCIAGNSTGLNWRRFGQLDI